MRLARKVMRRVSVVFSIPLWTACTHSNHEPANTLHLYELEKIKTLDPALAEDEYSANSVGMAYEGLLQYHYLKRPFQLIPNLAEAMPTLSSDHKTYLFKIKKGVLFQDDPCFKATNGKGRELVAEDFVYSYKRLADPKTQSPGWWVLDGKIQGLNQWRDAQLKAGSSDYTAEISGLKALDHYTLQITLTKPSFQFIFNLAMPFTSVVPHELFETYGPQSGNHAVGTGPFRLVEFDPSSKIIWDKNPTYRQEFYPSEGEESDKAAGYLNDAGKTLPLADRIVDSVIIEDSTRWLNFMAGKIDYLVVPKDNFVSTMDEKGELLPNLKNKGIKMVKWNRLDTTHESFNMDDPIVGKNKYLRQALSLAVNGAQLLELFYFNQGVQAQGPIPPGLVGYDSEYKNPYRQFNIEKAKELLAKAGYPGGKGLPPIEYNNQTGTFYRQYMEFLIKQFAAIGVKLNTNNMSFPEFMARVKNRQGQIWGWAWTADYPDAENFLALFYGKNSPPGSNDSNYQNPEYDKLYEKALNLPDTPERTALYKKMVEIVTEDCPWIFGVNRYGVTLTQAWMKNYKPILMEHSRFKYFRADTNLKK